MPQFNSSDDYSLWADSAETVHGKTKKACSFNALHKKYLQTYNKINQSISQLINLSLFLFFFFSLSSFVSHSKGVKQHKTFLLCKTLMSDKEKTNRLAKENIQTVFKFFTNSVPLIFPMNKHCIKKIINVTRYFDNVYCVLEQN